MVHLKQFLHKEVGEQVDMYKTELRETKRALGILEQTNINEARYRVELYSLWASEGEASTKTEHKGTLCDAIVKAEEEFKTTNHRSDIQARYSVSINLGDRYFSIPDEYWKSFVEKR